MSTGKAIPPSIAIASPRLTALLDHFRTHRPLRAGSLIVTVFGDCIAPRGGEVWLGSLIAAMAPLGISQRLVRTSVYRLVQDGILYNRAAGRRSFYTLTDAGRAQFHSATARIYAPPHPNLQGHWRLLLLANVPAALRPKVRRELQWLGFGQFNSDTLAHPSMDRARMHDLCEHLGIRKTAVQLDANLPADQAPTALTQLVARAWDLQALEAAYSAYLQLFEPICHGLCEQPALSDAEAFYVRTLMLHEYRRVVLRDPALPLSMLPDDWQGQRAYRLTQTLYRQLVAASERHLTASFINQMGPLPALDGDFKLRFDGLNDALPH